MACGPVCARLDFIMKKMDLSKNMTDSSNGSPDEPKESRKAVYEKDCGDCKKQLDAADAACRRITFRRGIASLAALVLFSAGYSRKSTVLCALSAAALAVFLMLVRRHQKLREHQAWLDDRYCVARDYLARFGDAWKQFPLNGEAYLTEDFTEAMDLDIFGRSSLYQYICTASTCYGQDRLAHWLCCPFGHPSKTLEQMTARQDAVAELAAKPDFSMDFETAARRLRHENGTAVRQAVDDLSGTAGNAGLHDGIRTTAVWLFPGITLALLLAALTGMQDGLFWTYFSIAASIQLFSCMAGFQINQKLLAPVYRLNKAITPYTKLLPALEQESFESPYLKELQKSLLRNGTSASAAFRELRYQRSRYGTQKYICLCAVWQPVSLRLPLRGAVPEMEAPVWTGAEALAGSCRKSRSTYQPWRSFPHKKHLHAAPHCRFAKPAVLRRFTAPSAPAGIKGSRKRFRIQAPHLYYHRFEYVRQNNVYAQHRRKPDACLCRGILHSAKPVRFPHGAAYVHARTG